MIFDVFLGILAMAPAPTPPGTQANPTAELLRMVGMIAVMGFVLYFVMIRPQRQRQKQLDNMLRSVKSGDRILTTSGIVGVVVTVKEKTISLRSADTKLEILKTAVAEVTEKSAEAAE